jgi:DNA-binding CsgD family transcriptional regulator
LDAASPQLTTIERRVLELLMEGLTVRMFADQLGLSSLELRTLSKVVFGKLQLEGRTGLARLDNFPLEANDENHPHLSGMDRSQLHSHLRARHGYKRPLGASSEELNRLHGLLHHEPPPSPA